MIEVSDTQNDCMTKGSDEMRNKNPKQQKINESPIQFKRYIHCSHVVRVFLVSYLGLESMHYFYQDNEYDWRDKYEFA